jgi:DNA excision repair protein ERCC-4
MSRPLLKSEKEYMYCSVILIDSREQWPLVFSREQTRVCKIDTGDYSIEGPDGTSFAPGNPHAISLERKSLGDLATTMGAGRDRFEREMERARSLEYFGLIIEGDPKDIPDHKYASLMDPNALFHGIAAMSIRYNVKVWFAHDHHMASYFTRTILKMYVREQILNGAVNVP